MLNSKHHWKEKTREGFKFVKLGEGLQQKQPGKAKGE